MRIMVLPAIHGMKSPLKLKPNVDLKITTPEFLTTLVVSTLTTFERSYKLQDFWIFIWLRVSKSRGKLLNRQP